jgi:hypothetical protein
VRTDTGEALSVVSDRYSIIRHDTVLKAADAFVSHFGAPEVRHHLTGNGANLVAEYSFKDQQADAGVNDTVGLVVYIRNAYRPGVSAQVRVGALVLACKNGMVIPRTVFNLSVRHTGNVQDVRFPEPDQVMTAFREQSAGWRTLGRIQLLKDTGYDFLAEGGPLRDALPAATAREAYAMWLDNYDKDQNTAWHMMQHITNLVTHRPGRLSYLGQLARLERVVGTFNKHFVD